MTDTVNKQALYRKKPVEVTAMQWRPDEMMLVGDVLKRFGGLGGMRAQSIGKKTGALTIRTYWGDRTANPGDWIVRDVDGEIRIYKPGDFEAFYEPTPSTPVQGYRETLIAIKNEMKLWNDAYSALNVIATIVDQALSQTDIQPSGWIPVSTPPKEREWYLVTDEGAVSYGRWHGNGWNIENSPVLYDVTHWMPLPPPPGINSTEDDQPSTEEEETDA